MLFGQGFAEQMSLAQLAMHCPQDRPLVVRLDALSDDVDPQFGAELDYRANDDPPGGPICRSETKLRSIFTSVTGKRSR